MNIYFMKVDFSYFKEFLNFTFTVFYKNNKTVLQLGSVVMPIIIKSVKDKPH